jgi:choline dehydrogenase-like flavoprotein
MARNPADSLPAGVDETVLKGYIAQRAALLKQFASDDIGVGTVHWGTANAALVYHLKPLSRGTVTIASTNPLDNPLIDFRTGTDPADVAVYTALFRKNRELFAAPSMQVLGPTEAAPFGAQLTTDEEIYAVMRDLINPSNAHQCCTAAMMPREKGGVVSSEQKVHGVRGLRVADISAWPFQLSGSPMATVYASAERVSLHQYRGIQWVQDALTYSSISLPISSRRSTAWPVLAKSPSYLIPLPGSGGDRGGHMWVCIS